MDRLLDCVSADPEARERVHRQHIYYVSIAELGYDVFSTLLECADADWCLRFLATIERGLVEGDGETRNLVAAGLFESLQSQSYRIGPADLLESRLGPRSLEVWCDLMEGWSGPGIRSVAAWRLRGREQTSRTPDP